MSRRSDFSANWRADNEPCPPRLDAERSRAGTIHGGSTLSPPIVTLGFVNVASDSVAPIRGDNLRVPRAEFSALWATVERLASRRGPDDFLIGVLRTCRWLADQPVWSDVRGRAEMPLTPITRQGHAAMPETVEEEFVAAAAAAGQRSGRPELARGVVATLQWACRGTGASPLDL
jgi:hypothetical protein